MHDHSVNLRNFFEDTAEAQWVRNQYEAGIPVDQIVANVDEKTGGLGRDTRPVVEYILKKKPFEDIQHLILPHMPNSLEFLKSDEEGHLYQATGDTEGASFQVLLMIPRISESRVQAMVSKHQDRVCYLAYKRAHEGYPVQHTTGSAMAGIGMDMLSSLLDD